LTGDAPTGLFTYTRQDDGTLGQINLFDATGVSPDPITTGMVNSTPFPNDPTSSGLNSQAFRFNSDARQDSRWITTRIDYELSDAHSISGSFHNFKYDLPNDVFNGLGEVFPGLPGFGNTSNRYLTSVAWLSTWSPNLTNELRGGLQQYEVKWVPNGAVSDIILDFNTSLIDNPIQDADTPQGRKPPIWELQDNMNWINGNHTFTFGGSYRTTKVDQFNFFGTVPTYTLDFGTGNSPLSPDMFPGGISTNDFGDAGEILYVLGGFVDSAEQTFNATSNSSGFVPGAPQTTILKQNFLTFHGGDTWRLSPNVTLNYGLRWEWHGVPYELNNLALLPKEQSIQAVLDPNAIIDYAGPGVGRPFFKDDYSNFAPNIGVAWRYCDTWVLRAGYSLNYVVDNNMTVVNNALRGNDGLNATNVVQGISGTVSGGGLVTVPTPDFMVPRTARDNILLDSQSALYTIDPNLRVPYVHQWNVGVQKEIVRDLAFEARYVGNAGRQLSRAVDLNQVKYPGEFVADWQRARNNLFATGDPYTGEELTYIPNLGLAGYMYVGFVQQMLADNTIGDYVGGFLAPNRTFFFAGEGGEGFGSTVPISEFYINPNTFVGD
ncbi:MAG: TonB-dependent receptor domain-containing protein, partial [bacterium]